MCAAARCGAPTSTSGKIGRTDERATGSALQPHRLHLNPPRQRAARSASSCCRTTTSGLPTAEPGVEWLHPQTSFNPAIPAIKVAVKHDPAHALELNLNGAKVSALNFEGTLFNAPRSVALSTWRGVSLAKAPISSR